MPDAPPSPSPTITTRCWLPDAGWQEHEQATLEHAMCAVQCAKNMGAPPTRVEVCLDGVRHEKLTAYVVDQLWRPGQILLAGSHR